MNALFCGQCGAQIPVDSIFCPMCGLKTAAPGAATMFELPHVVLPVVSVREPAGSAAANKATPHPVGSPPPGAPAPSVATSAATGGPVTNAPAIGAVTVLGVGAASSGTPGNTDAAATLILGPIRTPGAGAGQGASAALPSRPGTAPPAAPSGPLHARPRTSPIAPSSAQPAGHVPPHPMRARAGTEPAGHGPALVGGAVVTPRPAAVVVPDPPEPPIPSAQAMSWPGLPRTRVPITPRPIRIVLGCLFLAVTAWLALLFLPGHRPLTETEETELTAKLGIDQVRRIRQTRLTEEVHVATSVGAGGLALAGLGLILSGALYRAQAWIRCRRCRRPVMAWRGAFGLHCPHGTHYARVQWLLVGLTALFWVGVLAIAALIGLWLV